MRAIRLELQAFGPYYKKQVIDFNELGNEAIFLITGPTGAGKTTIFDAICYALYGKASGSDRDHDTLRSHFAEPGDLTEVSFSFELSNVYYQVTRSPKQLRERARGTGLTDEPAKATIYKRDESGLDILLYSRIKDVNDEVERLLGFDYEQFAKMVLIPQGEFRKLITENSREREVILQKIFRTYFYEDITKRLREKSKELTDEAHILEQQITGEITRITWTHLDDIEQQIADDQIRYTDILDALEKEINLCTAKYEKHEILIKDEQRKIISLREELNQARILYKAYENQRDILKKLVELENDLPTHESDKNKLYLAQRAERLRMPYNIQQDRLEQYKISEISHQKTKESLTHIKQKYAEVKKQYEHLNGEKSDREALHQKIERAKEEVIKGTNYFTQLTEQKKISELIKNEQTELEQILEVLKQKEDKQKELENKVARESEWIEEKYKYAQLKIENKHHLTLLKELDTAYKNIRDLRVSYKKEKITYNEQNNNLENAQIRLKHLQNNRSSNAIAELQNRLKSGEPCEICGSINHNQNLIKEQNIEFITDEMVEKAELSIKNIERTHNDCREKLTRMKQEGEFINSKIGELEEELAKSKISASEETLQDIVEKLTLKKDGYTKEEQKISARLEKIKIYKKENKNLSEEQKTINQTFDQKSDTLKEKQAAQGKIAGIIETLEDSLSFKTEIEYQQLKDNLTRNQQILEIKESDWAKMQKSFELHTSHKLQAETSLKHNEKTMVDNKARLIDAKNDFTKQLNFSDFKMISELEQAFLDESVFSELEKSVMKFEQNLNELHQKNKLLLQEIGDEKKPDLENSEQELTNKEQNYEVLREQRLKSKNQLDLNKTIQKSTIQLLDSLKKIEKEYYLVHDLASTAHGENSYRLSFERFVLATFLDEILMQANIRFERLSEYRYALVRSEEIARHGAQSGLDLEIMDYHTGQQRSVKTLSGGEGFKAALSLALGLADVVQAHTGGVQMDTMFIDEGFGTLDDDSLQQAIECLKDLQDSNRLLGIISHVPQLKSEIHAKLQIMPTQKGSTLKFIFSGE